MSSFLEMVAPFLAAVYSSDKSVINEHHKRLSDFILESPGCLNYHVPDGGAAVLAVMGLIGKVNRSKEANAPLEFLLQFCARVDAALESRPDVNYLAKEYRLRKDLFDFFFYFSANEPLGSAQDKMYAACLERSDPSRSIFASKNRDYAWTAVSDYEISNETFDLNVPYMRDLVRLLFSPVQSLFYIAARGSFEQRWHTLKFFTQLRDNGDFRTAVDSLLDGYVRSCMSDILVMSDPLPEFILDSERDLWPEFNDFELSDDFAEPGLRMHDPRLFFWVLRNSFEFEGRVSRTFPGLYERLGRIHSASEQINDWFTEYVEFLTLRQRIRNGEDIPGFDWLLTSTESYFIADNLLDNRRNLTCVLCPDGAYKRVSFFYELDPYVGVMRLIPLKIEGQSFYNHDSAIGFAPIFQVYNEDDELCWLVDSVDVGALALLTRDMWKQVFYEGIMRAAKDAVERPSYVYFNCFVTNENSRRFNNYLEREQSYAVLRKRGGNQPLIDAGIPRPQHFVEAFQYRDDGSTGTMWLEDNPDGSPKAYKTKVIEVAVDEL